MSQTARRGLTSWGGTVPESLRRGLNGPRAPVRVPLQSPARDQLVGPTLEGAPSLAGHIRRGEGLFNLLRDRRPHSLQRLTVLQYGVWGGLLPTFFEVKLLDSLMEPLSEPVELIG